MVSIKQENYVLKKVPLLITKSCLKKCKTATKHQDYRRTLKLLAKAQQSEITYQILAGDAQRTTPKAMYRSIPKDDNFLETNDKVNRF